MPRCERGRHTPPLEIRARENLTRERFPRRVNQRFSPPLPACIARIGSSLARPLLASNLAYRRQLQIGEVGKSGKGALCANVRTCPCALRLVHLSGHSPTDWGRALKKSGRNESSGVSVASASATPSFRGLLVVIATKSPRVTITLAVRAAAPKPTHARTASSRAVPGDSRAAASSARVISPYV